MKALSPKMSDKIYKAVSRYRGKSNPLADAIDGRLRLFPGELFPASHSLGRRRSYDLPPTFVWLFVSRDLGAQS
jgi:hypothetical protein